MSMGGKKLTPQINSHKGESASEQIVPKGIFLTECKVSSKNLDMEIERQTHKFQSINKNILSYFKLFYQEACLIFITTYGTCKHIHTPLQSCANWSVCMLWESVRFGNSGHFNNVILFNVCKNESFMVSVAKHEILYELGKIQ